MVVYSDDIVVHSESLEDHLNHLKQVFAWLRPPALCKEGKVRVYTKGDYVS